MVGCAQTSAQGGNCGAGALSAGFGAVATGIGQGLKLGPVANGVFTTVVGGVSAKLGGGTFEQGAITAAFGYLYNFCNHKGCFNFADTRARYNSRSGTDFTGIDPLSLDLQGADITYNSTKDTFRLDFIKGDDDWLVFGTLDNVKVSRGAISIPSDSYDFTQNSYSGGFRDRMGTFVRNIETFGAGNFVHAP